MTVQGRCSLVEVMVHEEKAERLARKTVAGAILCRLIAGLKCDAHRRRSNGTPLHTLEESEHQPPQMPKQDLLYRYST